MMTFTMTRRSPFSVLALQCRTFLLFCYSTLLVLLLLQLPSTTTHAAPIQLYGLNYNTRQGPDWDWDKCKSYERILQDLQMIQKMTSKIRLLSLTDCGQGDMVLTAANALNMQVYLGLWVGPDHATAGKFAEELNELDVVLKKFGDDYPDLISGVTVGSEAIYRGDATVDEMVAYMNQAKALMQEHSATVGKPCSIVDIAPKYAAEVKLREAVDVTFTNTFPFWEATPIDEAMEELEADLGFLLTLNELKDKPFLLGETGWPDGGFIEGVGVASTANQAQYFAESYCFLIVDKGWDTYWFTGIDNDWRQEQDPNNTIEGTWGIMYSDLTLKEHFQTLEFTCSDGVTYSFAEMDWTIPAQQTGPPSESTPADSASCEAHSGCLALELPGLCCPTADGVVLGCCDVGTSAGGGGVVSPTDAPLVTAPVAVAAPTTTVSPPIAPVAATSPVATSPVAAPIAVIVPDATEAPVAPVAAPVSTEGVGGAAFPVATLVPVAIPGLGETTTSPNNNNGTLPVDFGASTSGAASLAGSAAPSHTSNMVVSRMIMLVSTLLAAVAVLSCNYY